MNDDSPPGQVWWRPGPGGRLAATPAELAESVPEPRRALRLVLADAGGPAVALGGETYAAALPRSAEDRALLGELPPIYPEWLGDRAFAETHGCRFAYVVGEMAQGIATERMVIAAARAGLMGFFGSAGLPLARIDEAVRAIAAALGPAARNWGANLIHTPQAPEAERATVDLFLARGVTRVSASAFMKLAPEVVRFAATGLERLADGRVRRRNHVFAKVSRPEVARAFMAPPPADLLRELATAGRISAAEAEIASRLPVAEDITVEADSGGHTDNRPLTVLLPAIQRLKWDLHAEFGTGAGIRIGAAGGIGTPAAVAAAFQLGAAYVLTGSINQAAVESGLSETGRAMLAEAGIADVAMAAAADMFELGVKVQVLKRGTLFAARAEKLYRLYRTHDSLEAIPAETRAELERDVFGQPIEAVWETTRRHFLATRPAEAERAERELRHRMALVFRWYLFMGAEWARVGEPGRRADYQIWCGPAMGAFNDWVRGSFLEPLAARGVVQIGLNLMEGAAAVARAQQLRSSGLAAPIAGFDFRPRPLR